MTTEAQTVTDTILETAAALVPALAAADPKIAAVVAIANTAMQMLQSAIALHQASVIPADQLAGLFASISAGIKSTDGQWAAMNAADAQAAPAAVPCVLAQVAPAA